MSLNEIKNELVEIEKDLELPKWEYESNTTTVRLFKVANELVNYIAELEGRKHNGKERVSINQ